MYERFLLQRAQPAYRLSRWKTLLDDRAGILLARGYSSVTVGNYLCQWVDFVREYAAEGLVLPHDVRSPDVIAYLNRHWTNPSHSYSRARVALRHLLHDDDEHVRRLRPERLPMTDLFEEHVPDYLTFEHQHRGRRSSRAVVRVLCAFFGWIDGRGIDDISRLRPAEARDFVASRKPLRGSTVALEASVLRCFLRYLAMQGVVPGDLPAAIESPRLYRMRSTPTVLDEEIVERLLAAVDRTTPLGKRDYAMLLLGVRYGLRPCDIRGLRLDAIRWREQRLVILQSKTQRPLELPLMADVDEALVDYLGNGRPACGFREVFVRHMVLPCALIQGLHVDLLPGIFLPASPSLPFPHHLHRAEGKAGEAPPASSPCHPHGDPPTAPV